MTRDEKVVWAGRKFVWLVTKDGVFQAARTALVARPADLLPYMPQEPPPGSSGVVRSWAALTHTEAADPAWDAVPTKWPKQLPEGMVKGVGRVTGRAWEGGGLRYHLDDTGRPHPQGPDRTPLAPAVEVVDEAALLAHAEQLGRDLELVERGTGKPVKVERAARRIAKG